MRDAAPHRFTRFDLFLLWVISPAWLAVFVAGILVNSGPYRERLASLESGFVATLRDGAVVMLTYTLTNVAILCILAGVLGELGARAILGSDEQGRHTIHTDETAPKSSAVLRSFLVYLALIAGVLILGDNPVSPTQNHYVRLAGSISLIGFIVSYRPALFGRLLGRAGRILGDVESSSLPTEALAKLVGLHAAGSLTDAEFSDAKRQLILGGRASGAGS